MNDALLLASIERLSGQSCQPRWLLQFRVVRYLPGMPPGNPSDEAVRRQSGAPSRA